MAQLKILISHEYKLIYVWVPKCGSSTMFRVFQALVGVPEGDEKRRVDVTDTFLSKYNAGRTHVKWRNILEFNDQYPGYRRIAITRNPYDRLLSAYNNKIDIFAYKIMPEKCEDIADKMATARQQHQDSHSIRRILHKRISPDEVIGTLETHGTRFDPHFQTQYQQLDPDRVNYDRVFKLETFDNEFPEYLAQIEVPTQTIDRISKVRRRNKTKTGWIKKPKFNATQRNRVWGVYREDFDAFGYPK